MAWPEKLFKYSAIRKAADFAFLYGRTQDEDNTPSHDHILFAPFTGRKPVCGTAITDFTPGDDALLVVWDDSAAGACPPQMEVTADPHRAGQLQVRVGAQIVAQVSGEQAMSAATFTALPLSKAQALGLTTQ